MIGLLPPYCYTSPEIFALERDRIFSRLWIFVGLKQAVAAPDAFVTREIGGVPIVVQNMDGVVRAFENICAHRGKLIQREFMGTRPLVCGYHGWRYGEDGVVKTIPLHDEAYSFSECERADLRLREIHVRIEGSLIFVNMAADPLPIDAQFSRKLLYRFSSASESFDDEFLVTQWTKPFNWKLAYENLRDSVHPRFVHTKSLSLSVNFPISIPPLVAEIQGKKSSVNLVDLSYGGAEGDFKRAHVPAYAEWVDRWGTVDSYFNWLLFPNTHMLTADGGYSFSIEHHHPMGPGLTEITAYFMTSRKRRPVQWLTPTLWEMAKGAKRVLDEDTDVMEEVQRGFGAHSRHANQGVAEFQNRSTDEWYRDNVLAFASARNG